MLPASRHLLPVIGIDIHMIIILGAPVPVPHPFIGLVFDPMDWVPKIGASVKVNGIPRGNSGTEGMLGSKVHIPMGGPFAMAPTIGHNSKNVFGSPRVKAEGSYFTAAGFMVMSCNDVGMPLSITPGKNFKPVPTLYLPTSVSIPIPGGAPVIVGGPYVPDLMGIAMGLVMSYGFGAIMKIGGKVLKKALTALNNGVLKKFKCTQGLSKKLCKHGFEPINLITGSVLYEGIDFEIPGIIPIKWERNWYSDSDYEGLLGHGTHLCYDLTLEIFHSEQAIGIILPDGRSTGFPLLVFGETIYNRSEKLSLTCLDINEYTLFHHESRLTYKFVRMYDDVFKPTSLENESGVKIVFEYEKARLKKIIDTAGRRLNLAHDSAGRIIQVAAEHHGHHRIYVRYAYNDVGDLTTITDAHGLSTEVEFFNHLMVKKTDRNNQSFFWEYEPKSKGARCIHTSGPNGLLAGTIQYMSGFNIVTNASGQSITYHYDDNGLCVQEVDGYGDSIFHDYTDHLEISRDVDQEGNITGYEYDDAGNMISVLHPDGGTATYVYDVDGRLTLSIAVDGVCTINVYNAEKLVKVVKPGGDVTVFNYNSRAQLSSVIQSNGEQTVFEYDSDDNLVLTKLADGRAYSRKFDSWGRCIRSINLAGQVQTFMYDQLNRAVRIQDYGGNTLNLGYDAYDRVLVSRDDKNEFRYQYSASGKLLTKERNDVKIILNYNNDDRLISLINEHKEVYHFKYDLRGDIIQEIGFDGLNRQFVRDRAGRVIKVIRPANKYTEYEYDEADRITRISYSDGSWTEYRYDKAGRLHEAHNETDSVIFLRDSQGLILQEKQGKYTVKSKYNRDGKRVQVDSSLHAQILLERGITGAVTSITATNDEHGRWTADIEYNSDGRELLRILPGELSCLYNYDAAGHLSSQEILQLAHTRPKRKNSYTWGLNDKLLAIRNDLNSNFTRYDYNEAGDLISGLYEDGHLSLRITDKVGNVYKSRVHNDAVYKSGSRLVKSRDCRYQYDEEGNLISKIDATGKNWCYHWSANGTLTAVTLPDGNQVSFRYDALGRRTAKIYNGRITRWIWDGNNPLHEWSYNVTDEPASAINEFGELLEAKQEPTTGAITWIFEEGMLKPAAKLKGSNAFSIITDHSGAPAEMYDDQGSCTWQAQLDIYGKPLEQKIGKSADCPFRFPGQYEDQETGLYYNRFRYYDPEDGMYISQDPIRLKGNTNFYSYVSDPNILIDPFGLAEQARGSDGKFLPRNPGDSSPGADAVALEKAKFEADPNYAVRGEEISFRDKDGQLRRYDLVVEDVNTKEIIGVEVKASEQATYGKAQRNFDGNVGSADAGIHPVGAKAEEAQIKKIDKVMVIKCK
jgi:RHS repeat-associated protein